MINFPQALALLRESAQKRTLNFEKVSLEEALSRVAAEDYVSDQNLPEFGNSAMDGFALRAAETSLASPENPLCFTVLGSIAAGDQISMQSSDGGVWEIMTGAPMPPDTDAVVKIEDVRVQKSPQGNVRQIQITQPALPGQFRRDAGTDFSKGTPVIRKGVLLMPEHILALAAFGVQSVRVFRKPRVSVVSTGKEIVDSGELKSGQIRNSTAPFLKAALTQWGAEARLFQVLSDDPSLFIQEMKSILQDGPDLVITTGAVSMGKHDYVSSSLVDLGAKIQYHQIAMRPGKPNLFAEFENGPWVFGLPGNPVSTAVGWRFLIEPFLRALLKRPVEGPWKAQLTENLNKPHALRCFFKARLTTQDNSPQVDILSGQDSYRIRPLLEANSWALLPEGTSELRKGDWVDVYPLVSSLCDRYQEMGNIPLDQPHSEAGCCL